MTATDSYEAVMNVDGGIYEFIPAYAKIHAETTCLYSLEPIGIGTPFVESLSSYLARLAAAHMLPVYALLRKVIAHHLPRNDHNLGESIGNQGIVLKMNGMGEDSASMVQVLEKLTGRRDLQNLTMQSFSWLVTRHKLLSGTGAWCPHCLEDQRISGKPLYYPLLWSLEAIEKCPKHRCRLLRRCPFCAAVSSPITSRTVIGYCSYCNAWLGGSTGNGVKRVYSTGSDFFIRLFEWHATISLERKQPTLPSMLGYLIGDKMKKTHNPVLNRHIYLKKEVFSGLMSGQMLPTLGVVLWIAKIFKVNPFDVLTMSGDEMARKDAAELVGIGSPVFNPDKVNWSRMLGLLRDVACGKASSMRVEDIAKVYRCPPTEILSRYPELCGEITKRFNRLNVAQCALQHHQAM